MWQVATWDHLTLRKDGGAWKACCPFHTEKSGSFQVDGKGYEGTYKCFGCGEQGDIFDYWAKRYNLGHAEAVMALAQFAGVYVGEITYERPKASGRPPARENRLDEDAERLRPSLPSLQKPSMAACKMIAEHRQLDPEAVWIAARVYGRVGYCQWPQYQSKTNQQWYLRSPMPVHPSWAAIDATRNVAEFRRLDNQLYETKNGDIKTWSTRGKSWPLGGVEVAFRKRVLLVEGGPDMLAGYHFLRRWKMLDQVVVVCMLGAGNRIRNDALKFFQGARVRIMVDADLPKDDPVKGKRKLPGLEAAARWQAQLTAVGASVELFYVGDIYDGDDVKLWHAGELNAADIKILTPGFLTKDGAKVKDLNDLAKCGEDVLESDDVRQAMLAWDF